MLEVARNVYIYTVWEPFGNRGPPKVPPQNGCQAVYIYVSRDLGIPPLRRSNLELLYKRFLQKPKTRFWFFNLEGILIGFEQTWNSISTLRQNTYQFPEMWSMRLAEHGKCDAHRNRSLAAGFCILFIPDGKRAATDAILHFAFFKITLL